MSFAPQRRALFEHPNFQKWREHVVFCTFWLGNVLRATTACTFSHPNLQKWREHVVFCTFWLGNVLRATTAYTFSTSQLPKVVRHWCVLYILTSKCASRHNGVHFFDISTAKSGPKLLCFVHVDFEMCFAPQRRALFRHLNFQKCLNFHLSSGQLAPHPRFSEPTFRPSGATKHWKNTVFSRLSYLFAHLHLLSSDSFSSDLLSSNLSLLSASALLCFSSVHIVGSLTSKLRSIIFCHFFIMCFFGWSWACFLNRMVTSESGILHTFIYICAVYIITYVFKFTGHLLFCWSWACFMDEYLHILRYNTILHFFCIVWHCLLFMDFFCHLHAVPFTWKTRDGRKCVKLLEF